MLALVCSLFATAAPFDAPAQPPDTPAASRVLGGYNNADVNNAQVQAAAAFAAESVGAELGEVTSAQVQSTGGSNYRISFTTSDGRAYAAVVHRAFQSTTLSVTSIEETGDHHTDIAQQQADRNDGDDE